jgi:hypothetical protein
LAAARGFIGPVHCIAVERDGPIRRVACAVHNELNGAAVCANREVIGWVDVCAEGAAMG